MLHTPPTRFSKARTLVVAVTIVVLVGVVDRWTGNEVNLSVLYALPVILAVWSADRWIGVLTAIAATVAYLMEDYFGGQHRSAPWIVAWNACVWFSFLMLIVTGAYYTRKQTRESEAGTAALERTLPICACCRKIRDDDGAWLDAETYVVEHFSTKLESKLCPECAKGVYIRKVSPQPRSSASA